MTTMRTMTAVLAIGCPPMRTSEGSRTFALRQTQRHCNARERSDFPPCASLLIPNNAGQRPKFSPRTVRIAGHAALRRRSVNNLIIPGCQCATRAGSSALRRSCPVMVAGACALRRADANTRDPGRRSDAIDDVTSRHRMHGPCFARAGGCDVVDVGESSRRTKSSRPGMRRRCAEPRRLVLHIHPLRPARLAAEPLFLGAGAGYPR